MGDTIIQYAGYELNCIDYTITSKINDMPKAVIKVDKQSFKSIGSVDYLDEIIIKSKEKGSTLFTGDIISVEEDGDNLTLELESAIEFTETYMSGLQVTNIEHTELFYSIARMAGMPASRLSIDQLDNRTKEMCAFIPIKGLKIVDKEEFGQYQLSNLAHIKEKIDTGEKGDMWREFLDADGWLFFKFNAPHFAEAEELAIQKADRFLTLYSLILQYSYSSFHGKELLAWNRPLPPVNLTRTNMILLVKPKGGSSWLSNLSSSKPSSDKVDEPIEFAYSKLGKLRQSSQLALEVWNRFRNSNDYQLITVGFWQVVELVSSNNNLPPKYKKTDIKSLRYTLEQSLSASQLAMVKPLVSNINQYTLLEKLDNSLSDMGVLLSEVDKSLLNKFRKIRNDIEHGRKPDEPSLQETRRLKSLAGMIILELIESDTQKS